jgi:hypothetical protein
LVYEITKEVAAELRAKGVPLPVHYGPEATDGAPMRERIVVRRAPDAIIATPGGGGRNSTESPKTATIAVNQGVSIRIYARNPAAGARVQDHERRCEHVRDRVIVAFDRIVRGRRNRITWASAEYITPEDANPEQTAPFVGVVYELQCFVDRGIADRSWPSADFPQGAALDEVTIGPDPDVTIVTTAPPTVS